MVNKEYIIKVDRENVIEKIANIFSLHGYKINEKTGSSIELVQVTVPLNNRSCPIGAVSKAIFRVQGDKLSAEVELKGYRKLFLFLGGMIAFMTIAFILLFGVFLRPEGKSFWMAAFAPLLSVAVWPVALPFMKYISDRVSMSHLDAQLHNICNYS